MKKIIFIMCLVLTVAVAFTACGESEEKKIETITREAEKEISEEKEIVNKEQEAALESKAEEEKAADKEDKEDEKQESEKAPAAEKISASLSVICDEIKKTVKADGAMDLDAGAVSGLYGIDAGDIKDAAGFVVMAGTFPHEVIMVDAPDEQAAMRVESLLKVKHTSFVEQSKGYDAENYALAQKCRVDRNGTRISMFLSPDYAVMNSIIAKYK